MLWTPDSAQGRLLTQLGFQLAFLPESAKGNASMGKRQDIIQLSGEKMAEGLNGKTLMLFLADDRKVKNCWLTLSCNIWNRLNNTMSTPLAMIPFALITTATTAPLIC